MTLNLIFNKSKFEKVMQKKLFLLRHARALEKVGDQKDIERELDPIGLQNSTRMGMNLFDKGISFDIIISSPATRAMQTASLVAEQIKYDTAKIHQNEEIYEASVRTLLQVVNRLKNDWETVMIVGHNPSITYMTEYLTGSEIGNMTTCGLAEVNFEVDDWAAVSEGTGNLATYEYPDLLNF